MRRVVVGGGGEGCWVEEGGGVWVGWGEGEGEGTAGLSGFVRQTGNDDQNWIRKPNSFSRSSHLPTEEKDTHQVNLSWTKRRGDRRETVPPVKGGEEAAPRQNRGGQHQPRGNRTTPPQEE